MHTRFNSLESLRSDTPGRTPTGRSASENIGADLPARSLLQRHIWFAVLCVASVIPFWGPLSALVRLAYYSDYYSHTVVAPVLAGYVVYVKRKEIFAESRTSLRLGVPLLLAGASIFILTRFTPALAGTPRHLSLETLSVVMLWMGWFALCYGNRASRAALFPLLLLLLMVPLPITAMGDFIHLTRVGSTEVASGIFAIFGVPVFRHGYIFALPAVSVEVAKACSGIHSTIALFILTLVLGYLFLRPAWKTALLLFFVFPIVSLTNGLRIATLTLLAQYVDRNIFYTPLHQSGGILFFLIACSLMWLVLRLISREYRRRTPSRANWS